MRKFEIQTTNKINFLYLVVNDWQHNIKMPMPFPNCWYSQYRIQHLPTIFDFADEYTIRLWIFQDLFHHLSAKKLEFKWLCLCNCTINARLTIWLIAKVHNTFLSSSRASNNENHFLYVWIFSSCPKQNIKLKRDKLIKFFKVKIFTNNFPRIVIWFTPIWKY